MKTKTVMTTNILRAVPALQEVRERGRLLAERNIILLEGRTGNGKSQAAEWFATQNDWVILIRSLENWTPNWLVISILNAPNVRLPVAGGLMRNFDNLVDFLRKNPRVIVFDEGDKLIERRARLETIRDIHDVTKTPMVLVSEGGAREAIYRKSPRFFRRICHFLEFDAMTVEDVQVAWETLAELPRRPELPRAAAAEFHREGLGSIGEVMNFLEELERLLKTNPDAAIGPELVKMVVASRRGGRRKTATTPQTPSAKTGRELKAAGGAV